MHIHILGICGTFMGGIAAIAKQLGISYRTVEIHRSHILQKTGTANMLELAQLASTCGLSVESGGNDGNESEQQT